MIPKNYKSAAIFAALAFSYYPSNIISTQILTNHHAEVLMSLIGILLYQASIEKPTPKVFLHFLLCGFFFAVGNLIHRTVTVILIAVIIHTLLSIDITTYKRKILGAIIIIVGYMVTTQACYSYSYAIGILNKNCRYLESNDYLIHLAIGLNQETHGRFGSPEEHIIYKHINYKNFILMPAEDQHRIILKVIKERLRDPQLVKLISYKIFATWFYTDEYVSYWYRSSDVLNFQTTLKTIQSAPRKSY